MLYIIVSPTFAPSGRRLHGRFVATSDGRQLCVSHQPLLDASRILLAEGVSPETAIATRHTGSDHDAMVSTVGEAAKWTVREDERVGPTFMRWKAISRRNVRALVRFSGRPAPDTGQGAKRIHAGAAL